MSLLHQLRIQTLLMKVAMGKNVFLYSLEAIKIKVFFVCLGFF